VLLNSIQQLVQLLLFEEPVAVHGVPMREDLPGRFPIPERVWGHTEILRCIRNFHEVVKLVHDGLQSKKIALDGQTLSKIHGLANQGGIHPACAW
jgi:hypothetical protein